MGARPAKAPATNALEHSANFPTLQHLGPSPRHFARMGERRRARSRNSDDKSPSYAQAALNLREKVEHLQPQHPTKRLSIRKPVVMPARRRENRERDRAGAMHRGPSRALRKASSERTTLICTAGSRQRTHDDTNLVYSGKGLGLFIRGRHLAGVVDLGRWLSSSSIRFAEKKEKEILVVGASKSSEDTARSVWV